MKPTQRDLKKGPCCGTYFLLIETFLQYSLIDGKIKYHDAKKTAIWGHIGWAVQISGFQR